MSRQRRLIIIGLVIIGVALYAFNMGNVLFWDDADWITSNPCVQEPTSHLSCLLTRDVLAGIGMSSNYYRPVLMMTFAFNWALGGATPWGYHLISNSLHVASAVLIFLLLNQLLRHSSFVIRHSKSVAAFAALIWLIHPLQTEAVTYISGRGDPLSVFLMLSAILLWIRTDRWRWWAPACAVLAIFSRETASLLPLYLTAVLITVDSKPLWASLQRAFITSWPFYAISAVYGVLRLTVLDFAGTTNWFATSNIYTEHISYRIWTFLQVIWVYVRISFVPVGLHMERNVPVLTSPSQWPAWSGAILLVVLLSAVVVFWRRGNRVWFWAAAMFLIPLAPSSGILAPINSLIYEHWMYLSLVGLATLAAVYGVWLYDYLRSSSRPLSILLLLVTICYLLFLSVQTVRRNVIWGSPERLYKQILQYEPTNVRVLNNLANLYADENKKEDAERYWMLAIESDPAQPAPYHNLGNLMRDRGDIEAAVSWYSKAITVSPTFWYAYQNLAAMLIKQGLHNEAVPVLVAWQKGDPTHPLTYYALASIFEAAGRSAEARAMLESGFPAAIAAGAQYVAAYQELAARLQ